MMYLEDELRKRKKKKKKETIESFYLWINYYFKSVFLFLNIKYGYDYQLYTKLEAIFKTKLTIIYFKFDDEMPLA